MNKVGILTFHKSINYGSVLQAYALSKLLSDEGYLVEVIDYEPKAYKYLYGVFRNISSVHYVKYNLKRLMRLRKIKVREQKFRDFRQNCLPVSSQSYNCNSDLERLNEIYDVIICGSDQVWNVKAMDCDDAYFLPIKHKAKKIAYAVSVNDTEFTEKRCEKLKGLIEDFDFVSIREKSGADKLKQYLNDDKKILTAVDPTLLLTKSKFEEITSERIINEPYIFMYSVNFSDYTVSTVLEIAKKLKLPVYTVTTENKSFNVLAANNKSLHCISDKCSPKDFLSYIKYSELVLTNSFHGTAFSLIFEKEFFTINDMNSTGDLKNDERLCNILSYLGLDERLITKDQIKGIDNIKTINYYDVENKKQELINNSKALLFNALEIKEGR